MRVPVGPKGGALRVTLAEGYEAEGTVVDARGEPVSGAAFLIGNVQEDAAGEGPAQPHIGSAPPAWPAHRRVVGPAPLARHAQRGVSHGDTRSARSWRQDSGGQLVGRR